MINNYFDFTFCRRVPFVTFASVRASPRKRGREDALMSAVFLCLK